MGRATAGSEGAGNIRIRDHPCLHLIAASVRWASFWNHQFRRGEAFYWLDRRYRGQGITSEALNLITDWAFSEQGMARVHLVTHVDNPGSQRVAERCGFQREGVLRAWQAIKDDQPDVVMWSRLPGD